MTVSRLQDDVSSKAMEGVMTLAESPSRRTGRHFFGHGRCTMRALGASKPKRKSMHACMRWYGMYLFIWTYAIYYGSLKPAKCR